MMIDLHCHSTYSDGLHTPEELISMALASKVKVLALTDHDTMDGIPHIQASARKLAPDLLLVPGIELSVSWKKRLIHIIGLHVENSGSFKNLLSKQKEARRKRAHGIGTVLTDLGLENMYPLACEMSGNDHPGRPHFARVMVNKGHVDSIQKAFKRYLGAGRPGDIPTPWVSLEEGVESILDIGGQAVIAHPLSYKMTQTKLKSLIHDFKSVGGQGIEVVSGPLTQTQIRDMAALCSSTKLMASTGSDFHGEGLSRISLGRQPHLPINCIPIWNDWTHLPGFL